MWAINQEDNQQNLYFLINIKSLWYNNHIKENNCPLHKSFVAKIKTIDTSKFSYQECYLFYTSYSILNLLIVELKKTIAMIYLFSLYSVLKEKKDNIKNEVTINIWRVYQVYYKMISE